MNSREMAVVIIITVTLVVIGVLACITPARSATPVPELTAQAGATECWSKGRTLVHVIVRNTGTATGRYTLTVERASGRIQESGDRLRPGQAQSDGYMVRPGEVIPAAYVRGEGITLYYRTDVTPMARCAR